MKGFIVTTVVALLLYLFLTTGSGTDVLGLWSWIEVILGVLLAAIVGVVAQKIFVKDNLRMLNPIRWFVCIGYLLGPFLVALWKANLDVAYRVITGKINPGIVKISPGLKTNLGITMLANSITLTPGTLTVDIDDDNNDLYIHWINVDENIIKQKPADYKKICGNFPNWIRRIAE